MNTLYILVSVWNGDNEVFFINFHVSCEPKKKLKFALSTRNTCWKRQYVVFDMGWNTLFLTVHKYTAWAMSLKKCEREVRNTTHKSPERPGGDIPSICQGVHKHLNFRIHGNTYICLLPCCASNWWETFTDLLTEPEEMLTMRYNLVCLTTTFLVPFSFFVSSKEIQNCVYFQTIYSSSRHMHKAQGTGEHWKIVVDNFWCFFNSLDSDSENCGSMRFNHYRPALMMDIQKKYT